MIAVALERHFDRDLVQGAVITLTVTFDVKGGHTMPNIELYGTEGSMQVPDPNGTGGPVCTREVEQRPDGEVRWIDHVCTPVTGAFFMSFNSRTPLSYFASLSASLSSATRSSRPCMARASVRARIMMSPPA